MLKITYFEKRRSCKKNIYGAGKFFSVEPNAAALEWNWGNLSINLEIDYSII
jgi:hypothetical protein